MLYIILILIIFIIPVLVNKSNYSDSRLLEISKSLTNKIPMPYNFPIKEIYDIEDYKYIWNVIVDEIYYYDRIRNVMAVNQWSYYTVKHYTKYVLKYGSMSEKSALRNFVKLLDINNLL